MRASAICFLVTVLAASGAFATAQYPDYIVYKGEKCRLFTNPMEPYFEKHPEKRPFGKVSSTALWRNYVATFEFDDKMLVLKDIGVEKLTNGAGNDQGIPLESVKDKVIPPGETLKIDWFTGLLVIPGGEMVGYMHMGYGSTYSDYILLEIRNGKLADERRMNAKEYSQYRERQFQEYKKTDAYREQLLKSSEGKTKLSQRDLDSFLMGYVVEYTSIILDEDEEPDLEPGDTADKPRTSPE